MGSRGLNANPRRSAKADSSALATTRDAALAVAAMIKLCAPRGLLCLRTCASNSAWAWSHLTVVVEYGRDVLRRPRDGRLCLEDRAAPHRRV